MDTILVDAMGSSRIVARALTRFWLRLLQLRLGLLPVLPRGPWPAA
jgi:hypothetical protein